MSGRESDTLCWKCRNAVNGCCWSRDFKPVPGWEAVPTKIKFDEGQYRDSYHVIKCPKFDSDKYIRKTNNIKAKELGISERTIYARNQRDMKVRKLLEIARKYFYEKDD